MKSHTFTRGVALTGALTLTHAVTALAATSDASTTHAATAHAAAKHAVQPAAVQKAGTKALAQASGENTPLSLGHTAATHVSSSSGGGASIVRTIVGLFIVIAVIYGIAWILKQAKKSKVKPTGQGLSQVANLPLGGGRSVAVVRAGKEVLVVGVAENGVTPIRSYTEAEAIALGIDVPAEESENANPVDEKPLGRVLDGLRKITARS
ncbi:MAG TPA: flagellar biosynthetic protein FliO [Solirubrobacteraceae bacterium]|jgi:flagellar protein FliO/FliZ